MPTLRTDICVVGAGPAGLTLALALVRSGHSVVVLEKSATARRDFRGEILQPGGQALLDRLGVLAGARERGARELNRFRLVEGGRDLLDIDYRRLPAPYDHLLSIPQSHLLDELLEQCRRYDTFTYLDGVRAGGLVLDGGAVRGVTAGARTVEARCVVGADGRFSKVRRLADLPFHRIDSFAQDVLWFKVRAPGHLLDDVLVYRGGGHPVLAYTSVPEAVQIGWTLPHRGYAEVAARGFDALVDDLARAVPPYAGHIRDQIHGPDDVSLLDVFAGRAPSWARDGLVLLGDAAHTHGPIGAQGINLAIQDAIALHPVLHEAMRTSDTSAARLARFQRDREPAVRGMLKLQAAQAGAMLSTNRVAAVVRPHAARLLARTPLYPKVLRRIAYGDASLRLRDDLFAAPRGAGVRS